METLLTIIDFNVVMPVSGLRWNNQAFQLIATIFQEEAK